MHIDPKDTIAGQPAIQVRNAFKTLGASWTRRELAAYFSLSSAAAADLISALAERGLITLTRGGLRCTLSDEGRRFQHAPARAIRRSTADQLVAGLGPRIEQINLGPYAFRIMLVEVFGSYLTDQDPIGDIDLFVTLAPRHQEDKVQHALEEERREFCKSSVYLLQLYWPENEVLRALKARKAALSLHTPKTSPFYAETDRRILFSAYP